VHFGPNTKNSVSFYLFIGLRGIFYHFLIFDHTIDSKTLSSLTYRNGRTATGEEGVLLSILTF